MVADQAVSAVLDQPGPAPHRDPAGPSTGRTRAGGERWRRALLVVASLGAAVAFLAWIAVLAVTLPTRYLASHWNVAWVGFDVMLLISLLAAGWAVVRRRPWVGTALMVSAVMMVCDAWFDVTTASGLTATLVSIAFAVGLELPAAAGLAWTARGRATVRGSSC